MTYTAADVAEFPYPTRDAEEWAETANRAEASARKQHETREESWERSDTDGFLTQWAAQSMARQYEATVEWALAAGTTLEQVLFNLDGTVASTHHKDGQYGEYWVLNDEAAERYGKRFFSESKARGWIKRRDAHRRKGFVIGLVRVSGAAPKLGGGMAPQAYSEGDWRELRAGRFVLVHQDWLAELDRRDQEQAAKWAALTNQPQGTYEEMVDSGASAEARRAEMRG